jgi:imidazolonepropionase-like amidohydrolase
VGTLEPGKWADMVLLNADPLESISNVRSIAAVYKAGQLVHQAA